jgi:leucyl aminopeptidase
MMITSANQAQLLALFILCTASYAFAPTFVYPKNKSCATISRSSQRTRRRLYQQTTSSNSEAATEEKASKNEKASVVIDDRAPYDKDTHQELMYALGVNLARQLGDIRPLVETSEELASVAKGLLDSVVGRMSDEGQRELLLRRGTELNKLIVDRA